MNQEASFALPQVIIAYSDRATTADHKYRRTVTSLLAALPREYVRGISRVVLQDSGSLTKKQKRKQNSKPEKALLGTYHRSVRGRDSYITLFVDNITSRWPSLITTIPFLADLLFSRVLYHEIGHHITSTVSPQHRRREWHANNWRSRLTRLYFRQRYWYLLPILKLAGTISHLFGRRRTRFKA